jgi:hypothetical protein
MTPEQETLLREIADANAPGIPSSLALLSKPSPRSCWSWLAAWVSRHPALQIPPLTDCGPIPIHPPEPKSTPYLGPIEEGMEFYLRAENPHDENDQVRVRVAHLPLIGDVYFRLMGGPLYRNGISKSDQGDVTWLSMYDFRFRITGGPYKSDDPLYSVNRYIETWRDNPDDPMRPLPPPGLTEGEFRMPPINSESQTRVRVRDELAQIVKDSHFPEYSDEPPQVVNAILARLRAEQPAWMPGDSWRDSWERTLNKIESGVL